MQNKSIEVGRYLVSSWASPHADGSFTASVSIRSGHGMATTDRIMRFTPRFASRRAAMRYAAAEGRVWAHSH